MTKQQELERCARFKMLLLGALATCAGWLLSAWLGTNLDIFGKRDS